MTGSTIHPTALKATPHHNGAQIISMPEGLLATLSQQVGAAPEIEAAESSPVDLRQNIIDTIKGLGSMARICVDMISRYLKIKDAGFLPLFYK